MKCLKKISIILMIFLMSCFLNLNNLNAIEHIIAPDGTDIFLYNEADHQYAIANFKELEQWRIMWPQFQFNYSAICDSNDIWKSSYTEEAADNYDLRFQRNAMLGTSAAMTIILFIVLCFKK